jgi:hypothetical protein
MPHEPFTCGCTSKNTFYGQRAEVAIATASVHNRRFTIIYELKADWARIFGNAYFKGVDFLWFFTALVWVFMALYIILVTVPIIRVFSKNTHKRKFKTRKRIFFLKTPINVNSKPVNVYFPGPTAKPAIVK